MLWGWSRLPGLSILWKPGWAQLQLVGKRWSCQRLNEGQPVVEASPLLTVWQTPAFNFASHTSIIRGALLYKSANNCLLSLNTHIYYILIHIRSPYNSPSKPRNILTGWFEWRKRVRGLGVENCWCRKKLFMLPIRFHTRENPEPAPCPRSLGLRIQRFLGKPGQLSGQQQRPIWTKFGLHPFLLLGASCSSFNLSATQISYHQRKS